MDARGKRWRSECLDATHSRHRTAFAEFESRYINYDNDRDGGAAEQNADPHQPNLLSNRPEWLGKPGAWNNSSGSHRAGRGGALAQFFVARIRYANSGVSGKCASFRAFLSRV